MKLMLMAASLRQDSVNKKLIQLVQKQLTALTITADIKAFNDYAMPIYDGDIEAKGFPENTLRLVAEMNQYDGLIFSVPEYNYSMPGSFKNLVDWVSRVKPMPWAGKKILLLSASPAPCLGEFEGYGKCAFPLKAVAHSFFRICLL